MFDRRAYRLGLGTYSLAGEDDVDLIATALDDIGYRHVDTARMYENEAVVGEAIRQSGVDRSDLLVATKIGHFTEPEKTPEYVHTGVRESLDRLGVDTIDLLYHHWRRHPEEIETVLPVFEELVEDGLVEHVGVSNYTIDDLERARELIDVPIVANQVEMHPLLAQERMRDYLRDREITLVAYSPIAQGDVFDVPEIAAIADDHDTSPAVVSLAWLLSKEGVVPIPRSGDEAHVGENYEALDLELTDDEIDRIDAIETQHRCEDPDWMEW
jgi:2,5-diketo-D-gluconate reductase B